MRLRSSSLTLTSAIVIMRCIGIVVAQTLPQPMPDGPPFPTSHGSSYLASQSTNSLAARLAAENALFKKQYEDNLRASPVPPLAQTAAANAPPEQPSQVPPPAREVDLRTADGTILRATYFAAGKPGPGVLLLHQGNRTRQSWDDLAGQLAAAGINTLTLDMRGFGESGGKYQKWPREDTPVKEIWADDIDAAWKYLTSQPGVNGEVIGLGGAGLLGVDNSVLTARRHGEIVGAAFRRNLFGWPAIPAAGVATAWAVRGGR